MTPVVASFLAAPVEAARTRALRSLWYAAHGHWDAAHDLAQAGTDAECAWVHALLHREEGDPVNAAYWYRRASKPIRRGSITEERDEMIATLLFSQI